MIDPQNLCPICGCITRTVFIPCDDCEKTMRIQASDTCALCAADLAGADNPCPDCRNPENPSSLDGLSSIGPWMGALREWLSLLKYGGDVRLVQWPVQELVNIWTYRWKGFPVVPVPPRRGKIRREGRYIVNLIADELEKNNIPVLRILRRGDTMQQKNLSREERLSGEHLDYSVHTEDNIGKNLILLDDVATTGATLSRCATILKYSGVEKVFAMVICRD